MNVLFRLTTAMRTQHVPIQLAHGHASVTLDSKAMAFLVQVKLYTAYLTGKAILKIINIAIV